MTQPTPLSTQGQKKENAKAPTPTDGTNTNHFQRDAQWHKELWLCTSLHLSLVSTNSAKACFQLEIIFAAKRRTRGERERKKPKHATHIPVCNWAVNYCRSDGPSAMRMAGV